MNKLKELIKHQDKLIEGLFVSLIGGWVASSLIRKTFDEISNKDFGTNANLIFSLALIIAAAIAMGVIYSYKENWSRLLMFVLVYIYLIATAYNGYSVDWKSLGNNPIGNACFLVVLSLLGVIAFLYVKEDIFNIFKKIKISKRTTTIIVAFIGVCLFTFVGMVTVYRYITYSNTTFDFGIFAQMFEYMKQKGMPYTTVERSKLLSHFAVHFSPVYYIVLPIYYIFSSAITVQLIQAFVMALPVIPIVLLCRHYKASNWMTIATALIYVLYPATAGGAYYDIHENCFLTFFILMAIYAIEKKKNILLIVFALLTFLVKEDAAVYLLMVGTFFLFSKKDKKRGLILIVVSAIYFVIAIAIVNSFGLGIMENRFSNLYSGDKGGIVQAVITIINNPSYALGQAVSNAGVDSTTAGMDKIEYLIFMFAPIGAALITVGKKYSRYILLMPLIIINIFTTYTYMHSITFQYNFGIIALIIYILIMNMRDLEITKAKSLICTCVICSSIFFVGAIFPKLTYYKDLYNVNKTQYEKLNKAIDTIPRDASVSVSGYLMPHLSRNLILYDQAHMDNDVYTEYLIIDERSKDSTTLFSSLIASGQYEMIYNETDIIKIYKKNN